MSVQVITRDGEAEYAVLPWAEYQALLQAAGRAAAPAPQEPAAGAAPLSQLAALREAQGLSQADLARAVGISPHYLSIRSRWLRAALRSTDGHLKKIARNALLTYTCV